MYDTIRIKNGWAEASVCLRNKASRKVAKFAQRRKDSFKHCDLLAKLCSLGDFAVKLLL